MSTITKQQWGIVCSNMLGLRSGASADDLGPASYAMDNGLIYHLGEDPPADWPNILGVTIDYIRSWSNASTRYLIICKPSIGSSSDYPGTFPKCSARPRVALAAHLIGQTSTDDLKTWVIGQIPSR